MAERPSSSYRYVRMVAGFCGMILLAAGSALILGEILYMARQSGASSLTEFDGPALLVLFAVTASVLGVVILVTARRMIRGRR